MRYVRVLRYGTGFALSFVLLLGVTGLLGSAGAQEDPRTKEIREVEKQIAELKKKLDSLKTVEPPKGRRPLELKDALAWRGIGLTEVSRDGQWFACSIVPAEGKGEILVRQTTGDRELRFPVEEGFAQLAFSRDNKWFAYSHMPRPRTTPRLPGADTTPPTPPTGKVVLVNLAKSDKVEYEGVTRFTFSGEASNVLALHKSSAMPAMPTGIGAGGATPPAAPRSRGGDLILRDLATGKELTLGNVAEFSFDKKGQWLAMVIDTQGQLGNGVQLRNMKTAVLYQLDSSRATYAGLNWTEKGDAFSMLKGVEDKTLKDKRYSVLGFTNLNGASPTVVAYDPGSDSTFPKDMTISGTRSAMFSEDLSAFYFGIHQPRKADNPLSKAMGKDGKLDPTKGKAALEAMMKGKAEKPDLVIWHHKDARLQAQQQVEAGRDRQISDLCVYRLKDKKFLRLADDSLKTVAVAPKQRYAIGYDRRAYELKGSLDGQRLQDIYVIDLQTGDRHLALKQLRSSMFAGQVSSSPDGTHFLYYNDGQYHVYDMVAKKSRCISKDAGTSFINTEDDHNIDRPPTPPLGWTSDSSAVLISDNWDVWKLPVKDGQAMNLTGNGKKDSIRYRFRIPVYPEEKGIDLTVPQYFSAYGEWSKKSGFVRLEPKSTAPTVLTWDDAAFGTMMKARDADVFVYTRETTADYPDYYSTDAGFKSPRRLTKANPDQEKYLWSAGSVLVNYESAKGDRLQGALFLPAGYEKGKQYPTIVYIYERLSQGKNRYLTPRGMGFSPGLYTSNGYAVLMPDIRYKINDPGMSAVWCVLPALEAAIGTGVVDRDRVGLHGHSWGGYQTAFLITQTPAFKAAVAGAPLTNLVSMYSSIYWNTGWANQPIFESSQGRFTGGYWEQQEAYIRNSPVFHAKNVKTPLLLLHNDKDGAVDWNQGIEYFNTLRRLNKPVVMLQYKGENHGLVKPANQKDYTVRMREFFDHHLRSKPAPAWLKEGVPHLKMEDHLNERAREK